VILILNPTIFDSVQDFINDPYTGENINCEDSEDIITVKRKVDFLMRK